MILDFRKQSIQAGEPITKEEGMKVCCYVRKNRCIFDRNPYVSSSFYLVYGEGTEQVLETLQVAIDKGGAWLREDDPNTGDPRVLPNGDILKWQGKTAFKEYCKANPDYFENLKDRCGGGAYQSLSEEEIKAIEEEEKADDAFMANLTAEMEKEEKKTSKKSKKKDTEKDKIDIFVYLLCIKIIKNKNKKKYLSINTKNKDMQIERKELFMIKQIIKIILSKTTTKKLTKGIN